MFCPPSTSGGGPAKDGYPWQRRKEGGLRLLVRVTPKSSCDVLEGIERLADGTAVLKARVRASPHDGKANAAVLTLVARRFEVALRSVQVTSGVASRLKKVDIDGDADRLADLCVLLFLSGVSESVGSMVL
jgi:uncharacterized protein YggU (UPF0235/DUF167 family)